MAIEAINTYQVYKLQSAGGRNEMQWVVKSNAIQEGNSAKFLEVDGLPGHAWTGSVVDVSGVLILSPYRRRFRFPYPSTSAIR